MLAWIYAHFAWIMDMSAQELTGVDHPIELAIEMIIAKITSGI